MKRLLRFGNLRVPLPAFAFQLQVLDGDRVGVGVELGRDLVLARPGPVDLVGDRDLPRLVEQLDDDVLAEVLERNLAAQALVTSQTLLAHWSNSRSWVMPRSSVTDRTRYARETCAGCWHHRRDGA